MKPQAAPGFADQLHIALSTLFGLGRLPIASGTWGSLAAAAGYWFVPGKPVWIPAGLILGITLLGIWSSGRAEQSLGTTDPGEIIIDEVAGMWLALFLLPKIFLLYLLAFVLFRIFDITKPVPLQRLQKLPAGWGIMLDDIGAGFYALIILQAVIYFL